MSEAEGADQAAQPETTSNWYSDEYKGLVEAKKWDNPDKVLESYRQLESHLGKVKSQPNIPDVIPDDMVSTIYTKLGKPESADEYEYTKGENVTIPLDDALLGEFKQFAHGLNLTKKQFSDVVNFQVDAMQKAMAAQEAEYKAQQDTVSEALRQEWKENYETNFKAAKSTAEKLGILEDLEGLGLADNPSTIKMLHKLNAQLSEDTIKPPVKSQSLTPAEELKSLMQSEAFKNRMHPDHSAAHKRFLELHGIKGSA